MSLSARRLRLFLVGPLVAAGLGWSVARADDEQPLVISEAVDAVLVQAARSGTPILAVAGHENCREAPTLKRRLVTEPSLQPLVGRFALVELEMTGDRLWEWKRWQARFESRLRKSPQVFVIRADGTSLYAGEPPPDLASFLVAHLSRAGLPLAPRQAEQFTAQLDAATRLRDGGDLAAAVRALTPAVRTPSFAESVVRSAALRGTIAAQALAAVDEAAAKVADQPEDVAAALVLVATADDFAPTLPEVARAARERLTATGRTPAGRELIRQAELVWRADEATRRAPDVGRGMYERIIAAHPRTPLAELAAQRLERARERPL